MDEYILTYLQDILDAIEELDGYFCNYPMKYAINRILKKEPDFNLPHAKEIINTRNRIIHGYDSVTPEFLWSLIIKHIPILKADIKRILQNAG